jgi:aldose 1-epimerase
MSILTTPFGTMPNGSSVELYTLTNRNGLVARITAFGGTLVELHVPDRRGRLANVVLGYDSLALCMADDSFLGVTVGRYANRIAGGRFVLNGKTYQLPINEPTKNNTLHGGAMGFHRRLFRGHTAEAPEGPSVALTYQSLDGEEGFPGNLSVSVIYTLTDQNELKIQYSASSDRDTVVNLTNHSYFNLAGAGSGDVLAHELAIAARRYTECDGRPIPTGRLLSVEGTPLDFVAPRPIGQRIGQIGDLGGYDHNFVLDCGGGTLSSAARVREPVSGRSMEVWTTEPGVQLYTANHFDGRHAGIGGAYVKHAGFCLETQHFPDSPNRPEFPTTLLRAGQRFYSMTVHRFSAT